MIGTMALIFAGAFAIDAANLAYKFYRIYRENKEAINAKN